MSFAADSELAFHERRHAVGSDQTVNEDVLRFLLSALKDVSHGLRAGLDGLDGLTRPDAAAQCDRAVTAAERMLANIKGAK